MTILNGEKKYAIRITKTKFESMSIQVSGVGYDHTIYKLSFPATKSLIVKESSPYHIGKTNIEIIYLPNFKGDRASFSLTGEEEGWKGAVLFISDDGENYRPVASVNKEPTCGYIGEFSNEALEVILYSGKLLDMAMALIGREVIQFKIIELIGKNKYKLNGLIRGQQGTEEYAHVVGEKFILLDDSIVSFAVTPGKKFFLKAVTYGDSLENTEAKTFTL